MSLDIKDLLYEFDSRAKEGENIAAEGHKTATMAEKLVAAGISGNSEAGVRKALNDSLENNDAKRMKAAQEITEKQKLAHNGERLSYGEFQRYLMESFTNSLEVKNAQKVIMISTQENIMKGLAPEMGSALVKGAAKGQMSTVAIPTALLRHAQQEIGGVGMRVTQNDIITGFLYWYFGKPDDVYFASKDAAVKITAIVDALEKNASPSKYGALSYNASSAALDRLDALEDKMDMVRSLVAGLTKDSLESKIKLDKTYIGLCFNILNMLALTPPIMPGQQPQDIDMMAGGMSWDLMAGIDDAYDYFKHTNGREIYKAKARSRMGTFAYAPEHPAGGYDMPAGNSGIKNDGDPDGVDQYIGDDYGGYDSVGYDPDDDFYEPDLINGLPRAGRKGIDAILQCAVEDPPPE